ncbi:hypothetical protein CIHG_10000 [Coccidioides immitis H538.4]|uniref:Uncharacterized protein n=3 Tax=Coccidioides immitis TaxID=5501 RepID=A0A0J8QMU4_COCIT|nr:hypothetical protein CIRG_05061 [Coccidioides immitis RMSCC 2394]KMU72533.1 hypothetical protein CISG_09520 [Coccidioides immitis RMSCC 3703]KMU92198.1 hypothetical protein CIHG_10000 [Coccidioides immitis H538.4]
MLLEKCKRCEFKSDQPWINLISPARLAGGVFESWLLRGYDRATAASPRPSRRRWGGGIGERSTADSAEETFPEKKPAGEELTAERVRFTVKYPLAPCDELGAVPSGTVHSYIDFNRNGSS